MVQTRAEPHQAPSAAARAYLAFAKGDYVLALSIARELQQKNPSPESLQFRKNLLWEIVSYLADHDMVIEFNRVISEAPSVDPGNHSWELERINMLAMGGRLSEALVLAGDEHHPKLLGHAIDRALRRRSKEFIPEEFHPGFDAIQLAFTQYQSGNDEAAKESLNAIGLRSPYLEWKVLIRGLISLAAGDSGRAIENFGRLDATRLPSRLVAPVRLNLDPEYKSTLQPTKIDSLQIRADKLQTAPITESLRKLAREIGNADSLARSFQMAEPLVKHFKSNSLKLIPALSKFFYLTILRQGQPEDMNRFRRVFGNPVDDPQFLKLQAMVAELQNELAGAESFWLRYESWLAGNQQVFPANLAKRMRALIWLRIGNILQNRSDEEFDELNIFENFMRRRGKMPREASKFSSVDCFKKAAELAPDDSRINLQLFETLRDSGRSDEATMALRSYLERKPDDFHALVSIAFGLQTTRKFREASPYLARARAIDPLDQNVQRMLMLNALGTACIAIENGEFDGILDQLAPHELMFENLGMPIFRAIQAVVHLKSRNMVAAEAIWNKQMLVPDQRLATSYSILAVVSIAKLKPAEKKVAEKLYPQALAKQPTIRELESLLRAYSFFSLNNFTYRGQKTHLSKMLALLPKSINHGAVESDLEDLAQSLVLVDAYPPLKSFINMCLSQFPMNPRFLFFKAELMLRKDESEFRIYHVLCRAREFAKISKVPRHRDLIERIEQRLHDFAQFETLTHDYDEDGD